MTLIAHQCYRVIKDGGIKKLNSKKADLKVRTRTYIITKETLPPP